MEMRQAFVRQLDAIMEKDDRICIVDADLAKASATLQLREKYPDRCFDVGVAEANMASVAAGLSSYGYIPFITSFATFASRRISDQLSISIAYAKRPVKIIGTDPGITAELNGGTHMPLEDVAILRSIPNMVVFEPVDAVQAAKSVQQIIDHDGPVYIRLFRKEAPAVFGDDYEFDLMKADILREGKDVTILSTGIMTAKSLEAADMLKEKGISAEVINVHTMKPLDEKTILESVKKTGKVVTAENHSVIGGLYSAVCELLCKEYPVPVHRVGVEDLFGEVGKLEELAERFGLTAENICQKSQEAAAKA